MFRNRTRLKSIGQAITCRRCGRQRRAASTGKPFWDMELEENAPTLPPQPAPPAESSRGSWSDRLQASPSRFALQGQPEPRLNDLRPRSQTRSTSWPESRDDIPPALSRSYTHLLRRLLDLHPWDDPDPSETPQSYLFRKFRPPQSSLSRQDVHAIIHASIRNGRPMLAARFIDEILAQHLLDTQQFKTRVARKTLAYLFRACAYEIESQRRVNQATRDTDYNTSSGVGPVREFILEPRHDPSSPLSADASVDPSSSSSSSPSSEQSHADDLFDSLNSLTVLLRRLQDLRNPRPKAAYSNLIAAAVALKRPDIASGVYVGMVEEWIMEGRQAMGARLDQFHPGGGPPEEGRAELELASDLLKSWWKGIRSWSLPGEVLSPHARIDLWHPRKTSPNDRLRHFPLPNPTSPPSLVPPPDEELLNMIIVSLHLDSKTSSLEDFAASMRACASLANTIHSRTLPYMSKATLITVLGKVPYLPKVYPEGVNPDDIGKRDEWAYTAYTHVHLALQSLLWTPTTPVKSVEAAPSEPPGKPLPPGVHIYRMAPLSLPACRALMKYGFRKLQSLSSAVPTFRYLSATFAPRNLTGVLAEMFHASITSRNENMMVQSKRMVFASEDSRKIDVAQSPEPGQDDRDLPPHLVEGMHGIYRRTLEVEEAASPTSAVKDETSAAKVDADPTKSFVVSDEKLGDFIQTAVNSQVGIGSEDSIDERDESQLRFMALFRYYVWMNKPRMIEKLVYELLPHVDQPGGYRPDPLHVDVRPPSVLRPRTYKMLLWALRMTRQTALAQKVFHQALIADAYWKKRYGTSGYLRDHHRTLIHSYAVMVNVWKDVCHYSPTPTEHSPEGVNLRPNPGPLEGFSVPPNFDTAYNDSPYRQGLAMILYIYALARASWLEAAWDPISQTIQPDQATGIAPDRMFLNTVADALAPRWGVHMKFYKICDFRGRPVEPLEGLVLDELRSFIKDMEMFEVPVPSLLRIRAMDIEDAVLHPRFRLTIPNRRTLRLMNFLRFHRQEQDKTGRVHLGVARAESKWNQREPAADLWWWQARGGGRIPRGSMAKASYRWNQEGRGQVGPGERQRKRIVGTWVVEKDEEGNSLLARRTAAELARRVPAWRPDRKPTQEELGDNRIQERVSSEPEEKTGPEEAEAPPFSFTPTYT